MGDDPLPALPLTRRGRKVFTRAVRPFETAPLAPPQDAVILLVAEMLDAAAAVDFEADAGEEVGVVGGEE